MRGVGAWGDMGYNGISSRCFGGWVVWHYGCYLITGGSVVGLAG